MKRIKKIIAYILIFYIAEFLLTAKPARNTGNDIIKPISDAETINITNTDRILIFAPHPDDAALSSSGIIRYALKCGAKVEVVYITTGSHNTTTMVKDSAVHTVTPLSGILLARERHKEAESSMKKLGLSEKNLIFLGFPDFGTLKIWADHFGSKPYFSGILINNKTFFPFVYKKGVPFTANNELTLIEEIVKSFKPTIVIYPPTTDLNPDHRATGLFVDAALFDLQKTVKPLRFLYFMHAQNWPVPLKYAPDDYLTKPRYIKNLSGEWFVYYLTFADEEKKKEAILAHKSQVKSAPDFMLAFVRRNEIFIREKDAINSYMPLWTDKEMENLKISPFISSVYIGEEKNEFVYKIELKRGFETFTKLYVFIYPEVNGKKFADTPKYRIAIARLLSHKLKVKLTENGKTIRTGEENLSVSGKDLLLEININKKYFGNCPAFFTAVQLEQADLRISESPWWNVEILKK